MSDLMDLPLASVYRTWNCISCPTCKADNWIPQYTDEDIDLVECHGCKNKCRLFDDYDWADLIGDLDSANLEQGLPSPPRK